MSIPGSFEPSRRTSRDLDLIGPPLQGRDDPSTIALLTDDRQTNSRAIDHGGLPVAIAEWVLAMPAAIALGFSFTSLGNGRCQTSLPWRSRHSHRPGAYQAGPIGSLADFTGACAAMSVLPVGSIAATVDFTVKLLTEAEATS